MPAFPPLVVVCGWAMHAVGPDMQLQQYDSSVHDRGWPPHLGCTCKGMHTGPINCETPYFVLVVLHHADGTRVRSAHSSIKWCLCSAGDPVEVPVLLLLPLQLGAVR